MCTPRHTINELAKKNLKNKDKIGTTISGVSGTGPKVDTPPGRNGKQGMEDNKDGMAEWDICRGNG